MSKPGTIQDDISSRMKNYEFTSKSSLLSKTPVIIRVDGKAFHTLTRKMEKPFDKHFMLAMINTAIYMCEKIQGAVLAYVQSDEISLLLLDHKKAESQGFFNHEVLKTASVSASLATSGFTYHLRQSIYGDYANDLAKLPNFDARCHNMPFHEVNNYFIWRQQDATRNSILALGQSKFSPKQLHGKSCANIQDMLHEHHQINWNDCSSFEKRGIVVIRNMYEDETSHAIRHKWEMLEETPDFIQDRNFVNKYLKDTELFNIDFD